MMTEVKQAMTHIVQAAHGETIVRLLFLHAVIGDFAIVGDAQLRTVQAAIAEQVRFHLNNRTWTR